MRSPFVDRLLRAALAAPGVVVDLLDGRPTAPPDSDPDAIFPLVARTARHPESRLALEYGLHHVVHDGCVLAYEVRRGTAFAIGGLNVPDRARTPFLERAFERLRDRGLRRLLVFPLRDEELPAAGAAGFSALQVGVEAWLDLEGLTWTGSRYRQVREMRNRARRKGVEVAFEDPAEAAAELAAVHDRWLDAKRPRWRMKLLVGSPALERPFDRRYVVARVEGRVVGFCTVLPGAPGQWGVDVMVRVPHAPAGTMERLIAFTADTLRAEGATALSLGACPMAGIEPTGDRQLLRWIFRQLYSSWWGNQIFAFRSLHSFKQKFKPRWERVHFGARPRLGVVALYLGCRMWGLY